MRCALASAGFAVRLACAFCGIFFSNSSTDTVTLDLVTQEFPFHSEFLQLLVMDDQQHKIYHCRRRQC